MSYEDEDEPLEPECREEAILIPYKRVSICDRSFWDLWAQKVFRNVASVKYQFMVAFFWLIVYGMFVAKGPDGTAFIGPELGLTFLGGGFITLVTSRMAIRTALFQPRVPSDLDTDK